MKQTPQKARPAKQPPTLDARAIFFERLTEAEEHAMQRERKAVDYLLEPAYKLLDYLPPEISTDATDAIEYAIEGGEANGFCAGFYYALRMMADFEAGAARYYGTVHQEKEVAADGSLDGHTVMTVQEAERLGVYCPNFFAVYDLVRSIARTRGCSDVGSPNEWNTMVFLCSIYNAGRVDGIRAERAKRKVKCPVHPL